MRTYELSLVMLAIYMGAAYVAGKADVIGQAMGLIQ